MGQDMKIMPIEKTTISDFFEGVSYNCLKLILLLRLPDYGEFTSKKVLGHYLMLV